MGNWKIRVGYLVLVGAVSKEDRAGHPRQKKTLKARLNRGHSHFAFWCKTNHYSPGLRSFSPSYFQVKSKSSFAWSNSKGSDTTLMLKWLVFFVGLQLCQREGLSEERKVFFKTYRHTVMNALQAFDLMYLHGLWLPRGCALVLYSHFSLLLSGYKSCARMMIDFGCTGFGLKPKFHGIAHLKYSIRTDLKNGSALILNPIHAGNEQNEDKVGKTSRLSKKLSTRTLTLRILQRYLLKKKALLRRTQISGSIRKVSKPG